MKFTPDVEKEIRAALARVTQGTLGTCPICRQSKWQLTDNYVLLHTTEDPSINSIGGPYYPCAVLVCTICGNTQLLNLIVLGLRHLAQQPKQEVEAETTNPT
jgi:hypothetical protein